MPFCEGRGEHGGVHLKHKTFSCWQCGETASPPKLVKAIFNCSWADAYQTVEKYSRDKQSAVLQEAVPLNQRPKDIELPLLTYPLTGPGGEYLKSRGFDPLFISEKYGVRETGLMGEYPFRLIIPVYMDNRLVTYTTRDFTGRASPKYKAQSPDDAAIPVRHCLYNIDTVTDKVLIVEGPADVWRMGDGAVALFGTQFNIEKQAVLLKKKEVKRAIILLDPKTRALADKIYYSLISVIRDITIIDLEDSDPGELTQEEAMNLKAQIL